MLLNNQERRIGILACINVSKQNYRSKQKHLCFETLASTEHGSFLKQKIEFMLEYQTKKMIEGPNIRNVWFLS